MQVAAEVNARHSFFVRVAAASEHAYHALCIGEGKDGSCGQAYCIIEMELMHAHLTDAASNRRLASALFILNPTSVRG